jgi:RNA polymerase sigma-70 factor (ECF subfamily)
MKKTDDLNKQTKLLIINFLDGNRDSLVELFTLLRRPLYSYIYRMSKSNEISEDLLQETYITLYLKSETYNIEKPFLSWVFVIARNKYFEYLRHEEKIVRLEKDFSGTMSIKKENSDYEKIDKLNDIDKILESLSSEIKEAFILKHFQGLKFTEIAEIQNIPLSTAKSRVIFAIKKIRGKLRIEN